MKKQKEKWKASCAYVPPRTEVHAAESCRILAGTTPLSGTHGDALFNGLTGTHGSALFNGATGTHGDATLSGSRGTHGDAGFGGGAGTHFDAVDGGAVGNAKAFFSDPWG